MSILKFLVPCAMLTDISDRRINLLRIVEDVYL